MASQRDAAALGRARRAAARSARGRGNAVPSSITAPVRRASSAAQTQFADYSKAHPESLPAPGTPEANQLARMASYARWGRGDPAYQEAFAQYWYHDDKAPDYAEAEEEYDEYDDYDEVGGGKDE